MAKHMTRAEDKHAAELCENGLSAREVGRLMGRSDKSISAAVSRHGARVESGDDEPSTEITIRQGDKTEIIVISEGLRALGAWLEVGRQNGWVK